MPSHTADEIQAHNALIERNVNRAARRVGPLPADIGNSPVSDDEDDSSTFGQGPSSGSVIDGADPLDADLIRFQGLPQSQFLPLMKLMMSMGSKAKAPDASTDDSSVTPAKGTIIYKVADEKVRSGSSRVVEIPHAVWALTQHKVHIQLNSLTAENIKKMNEFPGLIKTRKGIDNISSKLHLLDQSQFGTEENITESEWHDGWFALQIIFDTICDPPIATYMSDHHKFCATTENFSRDFVYIRTFDIKIRRQYNLTRIRLDAQSYEALFNTCKVQVLQDAMRDNASSLSSNSGGKASSSSSKSDGRFDPYAGKSSRPSFQKSTSGISASQLCLICGRDGHLASGCSNSSTAKGVQVICAWISSKLTLISGKSDICLSWNLAANICRSRHDPSFHFCSICGSKSHHAYSRKCL